jgi:hypothetical protein
MHAIKKISDGLRTQLGDTWCLWCFDSYSLAADGYVGRGWEKNLLFDKKYSPNCDFVGLPRVFHPIYSSKYLTSGSGVRGTMDPIRVKKVLIIFALSHPAAAQDRRLGTAAHRWISGSGTNNCLCAVGPSGLPLPHRSPLTLATIKITTKTHEKLCAPGPLSLEIDTTRDYGRQRSPLAPAPTRPPGALHRVVASAPRPLVTRNSLASWLLPVLRQPSRQRLLAHAIIAYSRCCGCTPRTQGPYGPPGVNLYSFPDPVTLHETRSSMHAGGRSFTRNPGKQEKKKITALRQELLVVIN